jgi:5'-3' exonuclease
MVTQGQAYAVASEDMDSLTFGAAFLLKGFNNKKEPIAEVSLEEVLRSLNLTQNEFIDMCILLGSDYTTHVEGIGPANGYKLIHQYSSLEQVIEFVNTLRKSGSKCLQSSTTLSLGSSSTTLTTLSLPAYALTGRFQMSLTSRPS